MVRGRAQMKRIENPVHRQVTFCKRRAGLLKKAKENPVHRQVTFCKRRAELLKKAKELSVLCDADIGLFATKGTMQELIQRYTKFAGQDQPDQANQRQNPNNSKEKINKLKQEIDVLKKSLRYNFEAGSFTMRFEELEELEKQLEIWICNIRSTKAMNPSNSLIVEKKKTMEVRFQEIQSLRKEEGELRAANKYLQDKIEGRNIELTKSNIEAVTANLPYPLIIQNEIFQF